MFTGCTQNTSTNTEIGMFPGSKVVPKAMMPIYDAQDGLCKPLLLHILQQALAICDTDEARAQLRFFVVLSEMHRPIIEQFFSVETNDHIYAQKPELKRELECIYQLAKQIKFIVQHNQGGFGHAVLCAQEFVGNEPFVVLLGDHVFASYTSTPCIRQVINVFNECNVSTVGLTPCKESELSLYGIVSGNLLAPNNNQSNLSLIVKHIKEKPELTFAKEHLQLSGEEKDVILADFEQSAQQVSAKTLVSRDVECYKDEQYRYLKFFGIYCFVPEIFGMLEKNYKSKLPSKKELQLTDAICDLAEKGSGIRGVIVKGHTYDTGIPSNYTETMVDMKKLRDNAKKQ